VYHRGRPPPVLPVPNAYKSPAPDVIMQVWVGMVERMDSRTLNRSTTNTWVRFDDGNLASLKIAILRRRRALAPPFRPAARPRISRCVWPGCGRVCRRLTALLHVHHLPSPTRDAEWAGGFRTRYQPDGADDSVLVPKVDIARKRLPLVSRIAGENDEDKSQNDGGRLTTGRPSSAASQQYRSSVPGRRVASRLSVDHTITRQPSAYRLR
jgi:hypothetical protein